MKAGASIRHEQEFDQREESVIEAKVRSSLYPIWQN